MPTIWKYMLELEDQQSISMPNGAVPLCVQLQNGQPCVWARVDPEQPPKTHNFWICGTDQPTPDGRYLGTFRLGQGALVFHVFVEVD